MEYQIKSIVNNDSVESILASFFEITKIVYDNLPQTIRLDNSNVQSGLANALFELLSKTSNSISFTSQINELMDATAPKRSSVINSLTTHFPTIGTYLRYLLGEMECNIQQHAQAKNDWLYINYNQSKQTIDVVVADDGISIYGSYLTNNMHTDELTEGDASAIDLAQSGYSTKNRPSAENRGFGISSNVKIVTEVLKGIFAIVSGRALFLKTENYTKLIDLPNNVEWKGTIVLVRFPLPNNNFNCTTT